MVGFQHSSFTRSRDSLMVHNSFARICAQKYSFAMSNYFMGIDYQIYFHYISWGFS